MRVASQKEALGWNRLVMPTDRLDGVGRGFVPRVSTFPERTPIVAPAVSSRKRRSRRDDFLVGSWLGKGIDRVACSCRWDASGRRTGRDA